VYLVEEAVEQLMIGSWPCVSSSSPAAPLHPIPASTYTTNQSSLPPVDNLTIDNMYELPDIMTSDSSNVSQLSKTLIDFLMTRQVMSLVMYLFEKVRSLLKASTAPHGHSSEN